MNPLNTTLPIIHLKPGNIHFSEKPELVSIENEENKDLDKQLKYKYLDTSFNAMLDWFMRRGVNYFSIPTVALC